MEKRSKRKEASQGNASSVVSAPKEPHSEFISRTRLSGIWAPLLLAAVTFLVYWPSLQSDFVYDARIEILQEGFITSPANFPAVLSLHVLGMNYQLGDRPGQLLYLMLIATVCGKEPFGYHLCSNLLHAANVALLFVLLRRLVATETTGLAGSGILKVQLAVVAATLIFALHPLAVESVAEVSYSSNLLVTFFTLLALFAATAFRPEIFRAAMITGVLGTLCAFAAVTCKESGLAAALLLIVYWCLYRRNELRCPWFLFLGAATVVTIIFLAARFLLAPPNQDHLGYLGGSFSRFLLLQPQLWVFMMGKLIWPMNLSADYALIDLSGPSPSLSLIILAVVVSLQAWLAFKSRLGALGIAFYWLGLATVSNFIPLYRILGDRFYYLPMAGVAMQLLALFLMTLKSHWGFWVAVTPFLAALLPLTALTLTRQDAFANEFSLWSDTVRANPLSTIGHAKLAAALLDQGQGGEAIAHYQRALEISPNVAEIHNNLANILAQTGQVDAAIKQYQKAVELKPNNAAYHYNFGIALYQKGEISEAITQFHEALRLKPDFIEAQKNLAKARSTTSQRTPHN